MPVVAVTALKQAPGATTVAVGMAKVFAEVGATILLEADPRGGHLAARTDLALDPSTLTLVSASRRVISDELLDAHSQSFGGAFAVVTAPTVEREAELAAQALAHRVSDLTGSTRLIVADCGRLAMQSSSLPILRQAELVLCALFPTLESAEPAATDLAENGLVDRTVLVVHGEFPWTAGEVAEFTGLPAIALPHDPGGVGALYERAPRSGSSPFVRACRTHREGLLERIRRVPMAQEVTAARHGETA